MSVFGIDLGTTNSCIAELDLKTGLPKVIPNCENLQTTPSIVFYNEYDQPVVGGEAKRSMVQDPSRAVIGIKREMSNIEYHRKIANEEITPVMISAMILKKLVDDANLARSYQNKEPINDVVITVPAKFGNQARSLTIQAGKMAGLNVLGLVNEPTAAALSGCKFRDGDAFAVYDLGGGTFDISILKMKDGVFKTLSTDGVEHLGGIDWDAALVDSVLAKECKVNERYADIKDTRDGCAMIQAAEICKMALSEQEQAPMRFRYKGKMHTASVSRAYFEELTDELLQKTMQCFEMAISRAKESEPDLKIQSIILVGGSCRMPMVRKALENKYPDMTIKLEQFEPDLAIAKGAVIYADLLSQNKINDLASHSYGTTMYQNDDLVVQNLVKLSDPMVIEGRSKTYCTRQPNQRIMEMDVYENTVDDLSQPVSLNDCTLVSRQCLDFGKPVPQRTQVTVSISRNQDGIIHLVAKALEKELKVDIKPNNGLTEEKFNLYRDKIGGMEL